MSDELTEEHLEGFERVCTVDEVPEQMPRRVKVDGRGVLVCRSGDEIFAVDEICPHKNRSMKWGVLFQGKIICPHHQYQFDLQTGRCNQRCAPVQTYEVKIVDGQVWVRP